MNKVIAHLIAGPTASGKSRLALEIAQNQNGVIINADAMQVYSGLPILTAQPSREEIETAPHELYGVIDPSENFSAGKWRKIAVKCIQQTLEKGKTPIITGGTGLYFKVLLEGLAEIPPIPQSVRQEAKQLYEKIGHTAFREELTKMDPKSAKSIKPNDKQRLIRAWEVAKFTGKPLGYWQKKTAASGLPDSLFFHKHLLMPPKDELYKACDKRFVEMMKKGAIDEVKALLRKNLDPDLPAMKIIGVKEISAFLKGEITKEEAIKMAQRETRRYAKRQMTWFKNQKLWQES